MYKSDNLSSKEEDDDDDEIIFKLKKWNHVMIWSWDVNEDTCAICNISITDSCPRVSTFHFKARMVRSTLKLRKKNRNISSVWIVKLVHMQRVNVVILFIFVVSNDGITKNKLVLFVQTNGSTFQLVLKMLTKGMTLMNNRFSKDFVPLRLIVR